ncbi:Cytochrome P450 704C1 [Glycine max]|uniref:cytochrome P450 704B1-like n=1 Tax=Glycine max TaxID=3847 RepID=UPI0003DE8302|nr:cytochrome P450 704B1-like [Glycine max]KAH1229269.1 Cytochrome P450 704C1 [Glycine max]|eukprot:XP_006590132.1 cytochrome P450 704B1-like [Glycine max]
MVAELGQQTVELSTLITRAANDKSFDMLIGGFIVSGACDEGLCLTNRTAEGFKLLQLIKARAIASNTVVYNTLLHALCRNGKILYSKVLLVVELDTVCGTYKQGTEFSNAIDEMVKGDILSRFIELEETDPKYLGDISLSFILPGKDTISVTLSWFLYKLCKNPYVQEKTAQEIRQTTNVEVGSTIGELVARVTEENMDKMQYLNATLNETLRLHPAVPVEGKFSSRKSMSSSRTETEPGLFDP